MISLFSLTGRRLVVAAMVASLLLPTVSQAALQHSDQREAATDQTEAPQPKFIWGILIRFAASKAFDLFSEWVVKNMFKGVTQPLTFTGEAATSAVGAAVIVPARKSAAPILPNVTDRAPAAPLVAAGGKENYQGVHLALLVLQADGQTFKVRPIGAGFKSGEKFRIRLGATFDGELSLDNINPKGKRERLYPADTAQVVRIRNSTPVVLPLDKDSYFEFDADAGEEKLIITLRDPRAQGKAIASTPVHRQENEQGTGLLQEVAAGRYAAIAETIALQHRE